MRIFSIDLASHDGHLACIEGSDMRVLRIASRVQEHELIDLADAVLTEAGWTPRDLDCIACNVGPGGFTSVRSGVAFANALADQLKIPVAGYHGSALALARSPADMWLHSTKTEALFALGGVWTEPTLVTLAEAVGAIRPGMAVVGDLLDLHRTALAGAGALFPPLAPLHGILPGFVASLPSQKELLVPWYGRGI